MELNIQPMEKAVDNGNLFDVHSIFKTIQGEGPFSGRPAVFVRLAGCNLQCPGCDTEYTKTRRMMSRIGIMDEIHQIMGNANLVVVTGGEPFRQRSIPQLLNFLDGVYEVQVETNGVLEIPASLNDCVTVVCSPKTAKIHPNNHSRISHFKYVISHDNVDPDDGLPVQALMNRATPYVARPMSWFDGNVYVQPMDIKDPDHNKRNLQACVESAQEYGYIVQVQLHKILEVE